MVQNQSRKNSENGVMSRRGMLMKLGIAAGVAYAAPVMLKLGQAKASSYSGGRRRRRSFSR